MSQVTNQEVEQTEEFYKLEVQKMLAEMQIGNEKMRRDQEEIDWLKQQSVVTRHRIQENLERIEKILK